MHLTKVAAVGALSLGLIVPGAAFAQNSNSAGNSASTSQSNSASNSGGGSNSQSNSSSISQSIGQSNSNGRRHHHHGPQPTPSPTPSPTPTPEQAVPLSQISARLFLGSLSVGGSGGLSGMMQAKDPTCTLTMTDATNDGVGLPMVGSGDCPGNFDLVLYPSEPPAAAAGAEASSKPASDSETGMFQIYQPSTKATVTAGDYTILFGTPQPDAGEASPHTNIVIRLDGVTTQNDIN